MGNSIVRGDLVYFSRFGILYQEKSGNPDEGWGWRVHSLLLGLFILLRT
jgi:hypothetical protein